MKMTEDFEKETNKSLKEIEENTSKRIGEIEYISYRKPRKSKHVKKNNSRPENGQKQ